MGGHDLPKSIVGQGVGRDPVSAHDRLGGDERVHDRLLRRLDHRIEQSVDGDVADGPDRVRAQTTGILVVGHGQEVVAGREGQEQVAARVTPGATHASDPQARPLGQPLALVGQERRVRGDDHDDRA